ncbi:hypothetical protein [Agromyces sp. Soil535]|uniref:hypothetical protein n=1 Tax=Agromyces sp. Soil535 TaxID=1736390 RepID=UPI0006FACACB|nr:hypothetical protein [Agromyces sp. Soil535]KRE21064.1 hypothetical protein ASG80_15500 [Agromyces sp. Soil535]
MTEDIASRTPDRWRGLARTTGILALVAVVVLFAPTIAISSLGEPQFDATAEEAAAFFRNADTAWVVAAQATAAAAALVFLWFVVAFTTLLRRVESEPAWRSTAALASGVLASASGVANVSWDAASNRGDGIDPGLAAFAFDLGNLGFANAWLAFGSFAIASGWVLVASRALPAWWGWWAIVSGIGLIAVRYVWESWVWIVPFFVFWVWVIALAIRLIVRPTLDVGRRA